MFTHNMSKKLCGYFVMLLVGAIGNERNRRLVHHRDEAVERIRGKLDVAGMDLSTFGFEQAPDTGAYDGIGDQAQFRPVDGFCSYGTHGALPEHLHSNIQMAMGRQQCVSGHCYIQLQIAQSDWLISEAAPWLAVGSGHFLALARIRLQRAVLAQIDL